VLLVVLEKWDLEEILDPLVQLVQLEKVSQVPQVIPVIYQGLLAILDPQVKVILGLLVTLVIFLDPLAIQDHKEHRVLLEQLVHKEFKV
jgi:hypothetical protein